MKAINPIGDEITDLLAPPYRDSLNNPLISVVRKFQDWFLILLLRRLIPAQSTVLDVGCGYISPLRYIRNLKYTAGIDIDRAAVRVSRRQHIHHKYNVGDIRGLGHLFPEKSFDTVIAFDVVEHLTKKDGYKLIRNMEKIARKKIIIITPNGFQPQANFNTNRHQQHLSGWTSADFRKYKFSVYGLRGLRWLRGQYGALKYHPWFLAAGLACISEPILFFFPALSYDLVAVKEF